MKRIVIYFALVALITAFWVLYARLESSSRSSEESLEAVLGQIRSSQGIPGHGRIDYDKVTSQQWEALKTVPINNNPYKQPPGRELCRID
jgi:hypothetical protein